MQARCVRLVFTAILLAALAPFTSGAQDNQGERGIFPPQMSLFDYLFTLRIESQFFPESAIPFPVFHAPERALIKEIGCGAVTKISATAGKLGFVWEILNIPVDIFLSDGAGRQYWLRRLSVETPQFDLSAAEAVEVFDLLASFVQSAPYCFELLLLTEPTPLLRRVEPTAGGVEIELTIPVMPINGQPLPQPQVFGDGEKGKG